MKLFRTLRQNYIKEGNIKKYLLYAVGEIFLVMIGISLAFQLDNWNERRVKRVSEVRFYENIKEQIADDKALILQQVDFNNYFLANSKYLNNIIEANDRSKLDSIGPLVRDLLQYSDFDKEANIYQTLINSGEVKLLQNHEIVNGIREIEEKYNYANRMENIHFVAMMNHVALTVNSLVKFSSGEIKNPDGMYDYQFQNLIISLMNIMTEKDKAYHEALNEIEIVTELINQELETNN
ncbi:DUF6090 family protein [uncultured Lutibacter sp.]|uniref:DUF6090 family protein n=1 Tax=uncultured Lutibacter sp. TaxID=437739 RepID=UPI0026079764|nr:DUF6090 family protein [uncultured Lutibacter sp.]